MNAVKYVSHTHTKKKKSNNIMEAYILIKKKKINDIITEYHFELVCPQNHTQIDPQFGRNSFGDKWLVCDSKSGESVLQSVQSKGGKKL